MTGRQWSPTRRRGASLEHPIEVQLERMDPQRRMVARAVLRTLTTPAGALAKADRPLDVISVEGKAVTGSTFAVRVISRDARDREVTRFFMIKLAETSDIDW